MATAGRIASWAPHLCRVIQNARHPEIVDKEPRLGGGKRRKEGRGDVGSRKRLARGTSVKYRATTLRTTANFRHGSQSNLFSRLVGKTTAGARGGGEYKVASMG